MTFIAWASFLESAHLVSYSTLFSFFFFFFCEKRKIREEGGFGVISRPVVVMVRQGWNENPVVAI